MITFGIGPAGTGKTYLAIAMAKREGKITVDNAREIFKATFGSELSFDNLKDVLFVGDGTYLLFDDKYIEIRPSGTDAKTKAYGAGDNKDEIKLYAKTLGNYSGERTGLHKELITEEFYENSKETAFNYYLKFVDKGAEGKN